MIGERKDQARDNGYYLFKYIRKNQPSENIYYVIENDAEAKVNVEKFGNVIAFNSLKHYIYFFAAEKLLLPFETSTFPMSKLIWYLYRLRMIKKKVIFLQHGVTKDNAVHLAYGNRFKFDLVVCASELEREAFINNLNYPSDKVATLGFPRFDNLLSCADAKKQIFYMPTWRSWLANVDEMEFKNSEYYNEIIGLIFDERIRRYLLSSENYLILYIHDVLQVKFGHLFTSDDENIIIASTKSHDVQKLLQESSLLITDYSSVAFDFVYLNKPVIYYQFDESSFFENHFNRGWFDYRDNGFGPVCVNRDQVVKCILKQDLLAEEYKQRRNLIFPVRDRLNCKRNYDAIKRT
nr:CDP-glycerol glycerophosphotransferase family protein [Vibrio breoganii]